MSGLDTTWNVQIIDTTKCERSPRESYTTYRIQVLKGSASKPVVVAESLQRYSAFLRLHTEVQAGLALGPFAAPKKPFWGMTDAEAEERKTLLNYFIVEALAAAQKLPCPTDETSKLQHFLGLVEEEEEEESTPSKEAATVPSVSATPATAEMDAEEMVAKPSAARRNLFVAYKADKADVPPPPRQRSRLLLVTLLLLPIIAAAVAMQGGVPALQQISIIPAMRLGAAVEAEVVTPVAIAPATQKGFKWWKARTCDSPVAAQ